MNCLAGSIALEIMFYRGTQALIIHISRERALAAIYEPPTNLAFRVTSFPMFALNATFVVGFIKSLMCR